VLLNDDERTDDSVDSSDEWDKMNRVAHHHSYNIQVEEDSYVDKGPYYNAFGGIEGLSSNRLSKDAHYFYHSMVLARRPASACARRERMGPKIVDYGIRQ